MDSVKQKTREPSQTHPQTIQQTTQVHSSLLDHILPFSPYHHQTETHSRLDLDNPTDFSHIQSASAHHLRATGHKIGWDIGVVRVGVWV